MKPHTVMGSFLYEGYRKLGLKRINSADLASQFRRVLGPLSKNGQDNICVRDVCGKNINMSIPRSLRNLC